MYCVLLYILLCTNACVYIYWHSNHAQSILNTFKSCFIVFFVLQDISLFQVRHKPTGQLMVLKRNKKKTVSMLKEVELLKQLKHPNILQ